MARQKSQKKFFWIVLLTCFLISGGHITVTSANTPAGGLIISEFMAANGTGLTDEDGDYSDWIEIYNHGDLAVNLAGWALTDDPNRPQKWPFPNVTLGSREYLLVFASGKNRIPTEPGAVLHTNFKLGKTGEFLALHNILEGRFMDTVSPQYPEQLRDVSYGRYGDDLTFGYLTTPTPGRPNEETFVSTGSVLPILFSIERGFYEAPFRVQLTTDTPGTTIRYTTDGSEPTETNGTLYTEPIAVETTTPLRAAAFKSGFLSPAVNTQSYIFPDDVVTQFPVWDTVPSDSQNATQVIRAAAGHNPPGTVDKRFLRDGLTSIPAISLVLDAQSLTDFDAHPEERGKNSERPVSVEFIFSDRGDEPGPQINAGIRPYGKVSETTAKQSFRLFFRGEYGSTKLEYPLFPDSPVALFDTLVLQAVGQNNLAGDDPFTSNEWLRDSQIEMSGLGAHGIFVNLYLNGQYWGLYNLVERPDANFMSTYLGGEKEDWFVANQAGPLEDDLGYQANELNLLFSALALAPQLNSEPTRPEYLAEAYAAAASYFDQAQLVDYMVLNWYAQTLDWPESNWYAGTRLQDLPGRGRLLIGDEQNLNSKAVQNGLNQLDSTQSNVHAAYFDVLMQNPDFKLKFADRLYKHLFNDGALTDANAQERWQLLNATIAQAVVTESARWVDVANQPPLTRNDWLEAQSEVLAQMEGNAARLIGMAREMGYYPDFDPPVFSQRGGLVEAGFSLTMALASDSCQDCIIYYTTDGSDPRLPFTGDVIPVAQAYHGPVELSTTTQVKARVWADGTWSALQEATFSVVERDNKVRLTEIMYNPLGGDDYEYIELQNVGSSELDLAGISLDEGIRFTFAPNTPPLAPGEFAVLVSNPATFVEQYPDVAFSGVYEGHLSNKGEKLILRDAEGQTLLEVEYDDGNGWPISADGRGDSLTFINEAGNPNEPKNWRASTNLYGSPGAAEPIN